MIVDAHHHLWDPAKRRYPWMSDDVAPIRRAFTVEDLRAALPSEVVRTIVVQAVSSMEETDDLVRIAAGSGGLIAGIVGWVDLTAPDVVQRVSDLARAGGAVRVVGVRHQVHDEPDAAWLERPDVLRGLQAVAAAGLTFDLLVRTRELPAAFAVAEQLPQLKFVVDHGAKPRIGQREWEPWSTRIAKLASLPNVTCKISGLVTEADHTAWRTDEIVPYVRRLLDAFGPQRLMFGSDWPVCLLASSYGAVVDVAQQALADLTISERHEIFAKNAERIYSLN